MKTLKQASKKASKKAVEIHGFVIDNRAMNVLYIKVESKYSDEYITKKTIRYKLSEEEKVARALEDEKRECDAENISKGLSFLNF